jgi:tetratricopeptide (TPR) repeat protein
MNAWIEAERHAENATRLHEAGKWQEAMVEMRCALRVIPDRCEWHLALGSTLDALGRYAEAAESYEQVLRLRGDDVPTLLLLGIDLLRSRLSRRAEQVLARAAEIDPACEASYCYRILAHARLGEHDEAEQMFYLARQIVDECPRCYDHVAASLFDNGNRERAMWCWQRALRIDPERTESRLNLARGLWQRGELHEAREQFTELLRRDPDDQHVLVELGRLLAAMGRRAEATEKFQAALEIEPGLGAAHLGLGELAMRTGHLDAAEKSLGTAARLTPRLPVVYLRLAQLANRRGDRSAARRMLRLELRRRGREVAHELEIARMLLEHGMAHAVEPVVCDVLERPEHQVGNEHVAAATLCRGVARMVQGRHHEGIADCRTVLRHTPGNWAAMQNLVIAYLRQGQLNRAAYWLKQAMAVREGDAQLRALRRKLRRASWRSRVRRLGQHAAAVVRGLGQWWRSEA